MTAAAQNHQTPTPRKSGWSPERRAKQSAAIRAWSPWKNSTGPRTAAGKARAAQNAAKPENRTLDKTVDRAINRAMTLQRRYLAEIERYIAARKKFGQNELLKKRRRALVRQGRKVTSTLLAGLLYAKLCKKLDFSPPVRVKINANDDDRS